MVVKIDYRKTPKIKKTHQKLNPDSYQWKPTLKDKLNTMVNIMQIYHSIIM